VAEGGIYVHVGGYIWDPGCGAHMADLRRWKRRQGYHKIRHTQIVLAAPKCTKIVQNTSRQTISDRDGNG